MSRGSVALRPDPGPEQLCTVPSIIHYLCFFSLPQPKGGFTHNLDTLTATPFTQRHVSDKIHVTCTARAPRHSSADPRSARGTLHVIYRNFIHVTPALLPLFPLPRCGTQYAGPSLSILPETDFDDSSSLVLQSLLSRTPPLPRCVCLPSLWLRVWPSPPPSPFRSEARIRSPKVDRAVKSGCALLY